MLLGTVATTKVGRNDPCPCGSGKKFKACCEGKKVEVFIQEDPVPATHSKHTILEYRRQAEALGRAGQWQEALAPLETIVRLDPDSAQAHHDLGEALKHRGQFDGAVMSLRRALELKPGSEKTMAALAATLEQAPAGRPEAASLFYKLSRRAAEPRSRLLYAAKALSTEGRLADAVEQARRAVAVAPRDAKARMQLATLLTDSGLFDEAAKEYRPTLDSHPILFNAFAAIHRFTEADQPLIDRMRRAANGLRIAPLSRASVHFGLGKAFDDLRDYAEAMRHYDAANSLSPQMTPSERTVFRGRVEGLIANFGEQALARAARARAACPGEDKPVFIVGMPRSGTTLVEQILSSHPAVGPGGELPFWGERVSDWGVGDNTVPSADLLAQARDDYLALLKTIDPDARRVTDKAPLNFLLLNMIRLALPEARIIHCRRHPIDTCLSNYFTFFGPRLPYSNARETLVFFYRLYEQLMAHWRKVLPPERFTEVDYERLVLDREAETRRLVAFTGLEWDDACLAPERNERAISTASLWQARQPVYKTSLERWRRYEPWLGAMRDLLPEEQNPADS